VIKAKRNWHFQEYFMGIDSLWRKISWQLFAGEKQVREKIAAFEDLLAADRDAHDRLAELEDIFHASLPIDLSAVYDVYTNLAASVEKAAGKLKQITENQHADLDDVISRIDGYARFFLEPETGSTDFPYAIRIGDRRNQNIDQVGGKAASLHRLGDAFGYRIPTGFVITASAWRRFVAENALQETIDAELKQVRLDDPDSLRRASVTLQRRVSSGKIPDDLAAEIRKAAEQLQSKTGPSARIALRSSAVGEDGTASFAGQYRSLLNARPKNILRDYRRVLAGKYAPQALFYRIHQGLWDTETPMAVLVLEMIEARAAGVVYSRDPRKADSSSIRIHASCGPGEAVVSGRASPDLYVFSHASPPSLVRRRLSTEGDPVLRDPIAEDLAAAALFLEQNLGGPQDIEWCIDAGDRLVLLQSRPLRTPREGAAGSRDCRFEEIQNPLLVEGGETASPGIGAGPVHRVESLEELRQLPEGAVLVASSALPEMASVLGRVRAVVTDTGSSAGHLATVAREFGIPALVNAGDAFSRLGQGVEVTVHADGKRVFEGVVTEMIESPCAEGLTPEDTPFLRRMSALMSFVSPLALVDPEAKNFKPTGCRSLHDILRFVHEKGVGAMFSLTDRKVTAFKGARKLRPGIPMLFYVLDVGGGLQDDRQKVGELDKDAVACRPLLSLLEGLTHPDIQWGPFSHFDWHAHDKSAMAGAEVSPDAAIYASHAIISGSRMNLNLKFGYHFVILDARHPEGDETGHILLRFSGGGADMEQRKLRALFLNRTLHRIGFSVRQKSDLVDGSYDTTDSGRMDRSLDRVGRLLGATRLMDMRLKDTESVDRRIEEFFAGRYDFADA
jgi:pyruvate,water dikinase